MGKIGIFDSGFGGLTVLKEIRRKLPEYDYLYLGDSARAPYGSKAQSLIYEYTRQAVEYLFKNNCMLVILACNTASAEALRRIQQEYLPKRYPDRRVLGVIIPTAEQVVTERSAQRVGVIATDGTVKSGTYIKEVHKLSAEVEVYQSAAPLLVPLIESNALSGPDLYNHLKRYLEPLLKKNIDSLILGCTHYALIEDTIRRAVGKKMRIYNQSPIVASKLSDYLLRHPDLRGRLSKKGEVRYLSTDCDKKFSKFGSLVMGQLVTAARVVLDQ